MLKPTNPENAAVIQRLETVLAELSIGDTANYKQLNASAKRDVRNGQRWLLQRAVENTEKNLGCIFECVRSVGIRRMEASATPNVGLAALRRIRRASKRGKKRIDRANNNSMSLSDRRRATGYVAMLGAIYMLADGRKALAVAAVADPVKPIPPQNILDMFRTEA